MATADELSKLVLKRKEQYINTTLLRITIVLVASVVLVALSLR
jgi:hypothetical protein